MSMSLHKWIVNREWRLIKILTLRLDYLTFVRKTDVCICIQTIGWTTEIRSQLWSRRCEHTKVIVANISFTTAQQFHSVSFHSTIPSVCWCVLAGDDTRNALSRILIFVIYRPSHMQFMLSDRHRIIDFVRFQNMHEMDVSGCFEWLSDLFMIIDLECRFTILINRPNGHFNQSRWMTISHRHPVKDNALESSRPHANHLEQSHCLPPIPRSPIHHHHSNESNNTHPPSD